jgi:hypothetical protein
MRADTRITARWNQKRSRRDEKWGRVSELTELISVCHADTGDDSISESHGPVWLGLVDGTCNAEPALVHVVVLLDVLR